MRDERILTTLLTLSLIMSGYLLVVLNNKVRPIYGEIWAWRLIFSGYMLLFIETAFGLALVLGLLPVWTRFFNIGFCAIMFVKVTLYVIGFTKWARYRAHLRPPRHTKE